jgi:hypothetical protein
LHPESGERNTKPALGFQTNPTRTLHRHLDFRVANGKPNNIDLDSITYAGTKSGMCSILRIFVLKKFSFRRNNVSVT